VYLYPFALVLGDADLSPILVRLERFASLSVQRAVAEDRALHLCKWRCLRSGALTTTGGDAGDTHEANEGAAHAYQCSVFPCTVQ